MEKDILTTNAAKQACNALVFILERTEDRILQEGYRQTIENLCKQFGITVFGSLPE